MQFNPMIRHYWHRRTRVRHTVWKLAFDSEFDGICFINSFYHFECYRSYRNTRCMRDRKMELRKVNNAERFIVKYQDDSLCCGRIFITHRPAQCWLTTTYILVWMGSPKYYLINALNKGTSQRIPLLLSCCKVVS